MKDSHQTLDTKQLLGFEDVNSEIDLSAPELSGRVGAKVGTEQPAVPDTVDVTQLLGFSDQAAGADFRDPALDARVGAKIGIEPTGPAD